MTADRSIALRTMQVYWRWTRSVTLGTQGVVMTEDRRVLLVRHTYRPGWHFPGGGVERGETILTALTRELREEAGIEITRPPELFSIYANFKFFPSDHIALFLVPGWRQPVKPKPNAEIAEHGFFALDDLPDGVVTAVTLRLAEIVDGAEKTIAWN